MRNEGIAIAGNILVDYVKEVDCYPEKGMLANIFDINMAVGGCVPNTAINLSMMKSDIPIKVIGKIGNDEAGRFVIDRLKKANLDISSISIAEGTSTSMSDVISIRETGERTFFHYRGSNTLFSPADIDLDNLKCSILHIGYILLLDSFDAPDREYGTVMARFLHSVQAKGIHTSIDAVSDSSGNFAAKISPALKYCDYAIVNEIEGCAVSGLSPRDKSGKILVENIEKTLAYFMELGVRHRAVIHCPEAGFCMDRDTGFCVVPSLRLPEGYIKGSVGAGDAFCAGCLHEIYFAHSAKGMLEYASAAAAANLSQTDATSGMKPADELHRLAEEFERRKI